MKQQRRYRLTPRGSRFMPSGFLVRDMLMVVAGDAAADLTH
jgi:hypothetical protein